MTTKTTNQLNINNKKAYHDYFIDETIEAGIVLTGTEIKSVRKGKMQLKESYVRVQDNEIFLLGSHIAEHEEGNRFNHEPTRDRKLLMTKKEISYLKKKVKQEGYTLIPTKVYLKNGFAKVEVGVAKGKKNYDKRASEKEKEVKRNLEKRLKER